MRTARRSLKLITSMTHLILRLLGEVPIGDYLEDFQPKLKQHLAEGASVERLHCLGLGRFSACPVARAQTAFLVGLAKTLGVGRVTVHDPAFSSFERSFLESEGFEVDPVNREGRLSVGEDRHPGTTLFFLPHCPKQLTNNLLWANWSPDSLNKVVVLANSFAGINERSPSRCSSNLNHLFISFT